MELVRGQRGAMRCEGTREAAMREDEGRGGAVMRCEVRSWGNKRGSHEG